jgi:DNA-binding NarL/FixJ family response regulator
VKVFLVEDSPLLRTRMEAMLAAIPGASVVGHAGDAEAAIRGIVETAAEVVVLDIQLERGSGFDVMRALNGHTPGVDFYVLTNFANDGYRKAAERLGARGFFDKSNELDALRAALAARALRAPPHANPE